MSSEELESYMSVSKRFRRSAMEIAKKEKSAKGEPSSYL